jgi:hypothetical protein
VRCGGRRQLLGFPVLVGVSPLRGRHHEAKRRNLTECVKCDVSARIRHWRRALGADRAALPMPADRLLRGAEGRTARIDDLVRAEGASSAELSQRPSGCAVSADSPLAARGLPLMKPGASLSASERRRVLLLAR